MNPADASKQHNDVSLAGFRARAVAAGMMQLARELGRSGPPGDTAIDPIRDAIADELTVARAIGQPADEYRSRIKTRLDRLVRPQDSGR